MAGCCLPVGRPVAGFLSKCLVSSSLVSSGQYRAQASDNQMIVVSDNLKIIFQPSFDILVMCFLLFWDRKYSVSIPLSISLKTIVSKNTLEED